MRIGICDDILSEREVLKEYCLSLGYKSIFLYESGEALLKSSDGKTLDALLLDIEMDKIIEKMRAHGLKITKAQLAHCRNEYNNQDQHQGFGWSM